MSTLDLVSLLGRVVDGERARILEALVAQGYDAATFPRMKLLWAIGRGPGSIGALAREVGLTKQVCSRQVRELGRLGFVKVRNARDDARASEVDITPRGTALLEAVGRAKRERDAVLRARLGKKGAAALRPLLERCLG